MRGYTLLPRVNHATSQRQNSLLSRRAASNTRPGILNSVARLFRILSRLLFLTFLGLTTSIAIAWALAAWLPNSHCTHDFSIESLQFSSYGRIETTTHERSGMIRRVWCVDEVAFAGFSLPPMAVDGPIRENVAWSRDRVLGDDWGWMPAVRQRDPRVPDWAFEDARGWPIPCLWYASTMTPAFPIRGGTPPLTLHGGLLLTSPTPSSAAEIHALPYLPIWKGLIINTTLYTTLWAVAWAAFHFTRLTLRRRRGLCPTCAYDLKHNLPAGCPECGWKRTTSPSASSPA